MAEEKKKHNTYCPMCCAQDQKQPVLSAMSPIFVLDREKTDKLPHESVLKCHFEWFCDRCNYSEIVTKEDEIRFNEYIQQPNNPHNEKPNSRNSSSERKE